MIFNKLEQDLFSSIIQNCIQTLATEGCNDYLTKVTPDNIEQVKQLIDKLFNEDYKEDMMKLAVVGNTIYFNDVALLKYLSTKILTATKT